jgi:hypothetical protein
MITSSFIQPSQSTSGTYLAKDAVVARAPRYAVPPMKTPSCPSWEAERFPHRIYCMGLN